MEGTTEGPETAAEQEVDGVDEETPAYVELGARVYRVPQVALRALEVVVERADPDEISEIMRYVVNHAKDENDQRYELVAEVDMHLEW